MADSDNSRTLSTVTRADFHSFVAASLPTYQELTRAKQLSRDACDADPAHAVWHQWCAARQRLSESSLLQQRHESSLFSAVLPAPLEQSARLRAYEKALEAEDRASAAEDHAAEALWRTPARSVAGATAKLHALVTKWQPSSTSEEEPWPQIRSVIADLLKIDMASVASGRNRLSTADLRPEFQSS
ncbi:hypothetical protein GOA81_23825 [Sinorhizobium meliloti]|uniref:hypothetical protein n=1 Tax=Rhizobium meliloti TaxID=382 RepID=UPI000FD3FDAD|nr:hypothetical protein [Sinorhizobium meliloti]MDW9507992.1 hypothetical protein [Sinorhizobium meliloti]MDW9799973.1 hypothetical protein [Sinorhizobium meliloti]RVR10320.1 hypothetical protein CN243_11300 [Sinorhizobium meliloti]